MNIIFLDIEGVLNDYETKLLNYKGSLKEISIDSDKLFRLRTIVNTCDARIVITALERNEENFKQILNLFNVFDIKVIGFTPKINDDKSMEIIQYLQENEINNYAILDCEDLLNIPSIQEHLVQTMADDGIQNYHIQEVVNILQPSKKRARRR